MSTLDYVDLSKDELEAWKLIREVELLDQDIARRSAEAENYRRNLDIAQAQSPEQGEFLFYDEVTPDTVYQAICQIDNFSRRFPGADITVIFHSPGGYVSDGLHLYDFLQSMKVRGHHITTRALGTAASMGAILLQAGDVREMSPNCFLMIHEVSGGTRGKLSDQIDQMAFSKRLQAKCLSILAERATLSVKQVETRWKKTDWWMDADEALKLGLIDDVV